MAVSLAENTVKYKLFHVKGKEDPGVENQEHYEILSEKYLSHISGFLQRYIWQNHSFNLQVVQNSAIGSFHLEGLTTYDDNVEDEWFIVYLLFYLSEKDKNLVIQIEDNDGEFLLIEAADHLPEWLDLETSENRVFIHQGALHIIPMGEGPLPSGNPTLKDAIRVIRQCSSATKASAAVQKAIKKRISGYPQRIDSLKHRAHCYLPCSVAALLREDPHLLPHAVRAFYLRDPIDLKACRAMKYFAPETRVLTEVTFTRCLYAQLTSQPYEPDKRTGWNIPTESSPQRKSHELGMKLACGFEILASSVEKRMQTEEKDHDFCSDVRWRRFAKNLTDKGFFRDEVEGSPLHRRLLSQAQDFYLNSLQSNNSLHPGVRIHKLLNSLTVDYEEMKEAEKDLPPPDDDSWLTITPDMLESILQSQSSSAPDESSVAQSITDGLDTFVRSRSDVTGVEPPQPPPRSKKQKIQFDAGAFEEAVNTILDFRIPHSDDDVSSSSMSGYSDDEEEDVHLAEGTAPDPSLKAYMDSMDRELSSTNVGLSFERTTTDDINDVNDDDFRPVDINLTALKNILESYESQHGRPGPVSTLFSSMGIPMPPENAD